MTATFDTSLGTPPLADAIDRHPLIVAPDTRLIDAIGLMHTTSDRSHSSATHELQGARSSCVLVMQDQKLLGIFTERDLVQLTAFGIDLQSTPICEVMHHPVLTMSEPDLHDVFAALFLFRRHRVRHLVIVNHQQLAGVVSLDSIRHVLRPANLLKIRRVAEVMTNQVITALPSTPVVTLTELMATHRISCIVIVKPSDEDDSIQQPVGIVTERDIVRFQALGLDIDQTSAQAVMSTPIFVLSPEDSLWTAHQEMEQRQVRRLAVSWNWGQNLGLVTQTCILRVFDPIEMHGVIETLQRTIQQLGLDLNQVLAKAINHDTHLPASFCSLHEDELPNLKVFMSGLQTQIGHLVNQPELPSEARQSLLLTIQSELQHFQTAIANKF
jgi:signal-transduction protein with cAMP-binding, CBS, and nucleotidyltransferase domain